MVKGVERVSITFRTIEDKNNEINILKQKIERYERVISNIANIDASFLNGHGDMEGYSVEEELKRIHELVEPIWNELADKRNQSNS